MARKVCNTACRAGSLNKHSSNFVAEHVLKAVGAEVHGEPGSTEKGLRVVEDYLVSLGAEEDEFDLVNGSGLARGIQIRRVTSTAS